GLSVMPHLCLVVRARPRPQRHAVRARRANRCLRGEPQDATTRGRDVRRLLPLCWGLWYFGFDRAAWLDRLSQAGVRLPPTRASRHLWRACSLHHGRRQLARPPAFTARRLRLRGRALRRCEPLCDVAAYRFDCDFARPAVEI